MECPAERMVKDSNDFGWRGVKPSGAQKVRRISALSLYALGVVFLTVVGIGAGKADAQALPSGWLPAVACNAAKPGPLPERTKRVKSEFPRLAFAGLGASHNHDDPAVQAKEAKFDLLIMDMTATWGPQAKRAGALAAIKEKNPNIVIVDYVMAEVISLVWWKDIADKIETQKWWLYSNKTNPPAICRDSGSVPSSCTPNMTNWVKPDANGDRYNTWIAKYLASKSYWKELPQLDGTFTDNMFWKPSENGDWDVAGGSSSVNDPKVGTGFRQGYMSYINQVKALTPGKLVTGNIGRLGVPDAIFPEYAGKLDGGLLEQYVRIGPDGHYSWCVECSNWKKFMDRYRKVLGAMSSLKLVAMNQHDKKTDYRAMRYGLSSTLMDDGYYSFSNTSSGGIYSPENVAWFDEFDLAGTGNTKWLGKAIDPPQTVAYQKGVYMRRFQGGAVLVNPRGNGTQTITLPDGFKRFKGNQDPSVNNGLPVTTLTLREIDGILLARSGAEVPCASD